MGLFWNFDYNTYHFGAMMPNTKKTSHKPVLIRDYLADYRTDLANKRTFLSYIRTALALFAAGLALMKFFGHYLIVGLGILLLPTGVLIFVHGVITYNRMKKVTRAEEEKLRKLEAQN